MLPARWCLLIAGACSVLSSVRAGAIPRFAARNGLECLQCHVSPTGGGMRNEYGRNVFEHAFLPQRPKPPENWHALEFPEEGAPPEERGGGTSGFSPDLTEWLAVGADLRTAYILIRPDRTPGGLISSFFLMQADLYHAAKVHERVTLYLDVGVYSGFEAWGLFGLTGAGSPLELMLKVGRFLPPLGIREVEHQLFTREGIGMGASDRDTGLELSAFFGPWSLNAALLNGTLGEASFDTTGSSRHTFEKAVATRAAYRLTAGELRAQLGGSFYFSDNNNQLNPLFGGVLPPSLASEVSQGVSDLRTGPFLTLSRGRLTYLGDLVLVRDRFTAPALSSLTGYASYQELSFIPTQGLELVGTYEYMDPDVEVLGNATQRAGLVLELFPLPFVEVRAMVRRTFGQPAAGPLWDGVLFLHLFL